MCRYISHRTGRNMMGPTLLKFCDDLIINFVIKWILIIWFLGGLVMDICFILELWLVPLVVCGGQLSLSSVCTIPPFVIFLSSFLLAFSTVRYCEGSVTMSLWLLLFVLHGCYLVRGHGLCFLLLDSSLQPLFIVQICIASFSLL